MKFQLSTGLTATTLRPRSADVVRLERNPDPIAHPHARAREVVRALNAAKLERMHARPFVAALTGHTDGVSVLSKHPTRLNVVMSASCDGELKVWNMVSRTIITSLPGAHRSWVRGIAMSRDGEAWFSCGDDCTVKMWRYHHGNQLTVLDSERYNGEYFLQGEMYDVPEEQRKKSNEPSIADLQLNSWTEKHPLTGVDTNWANSRQFATSGAALQLWDVNRSGPLQTFEWGVDTVNMVKFNPVQTDVIASAASDRSIALYDIRQETPLRKLILAMRSNAVAWNPMEAMHFTVANEDHNLYTFDMRRFDKAMLIHKDHVSAVMSVDYSPTGREFVSGSYDRTVRIYNSLDPNGRSRDIYHTKRMQKVFSVLFSCDARHVISGSDDMNIRIWKADAAMPNKPLLPRERRALDYAKALTNTHQYIPQVRRIIKQRLVPKNIKKATNLKQVMDQADRRKLENRKKHAGSVGVKTLPAKKEQIVAEVE